MVGRGAELAEREGSRGKRAMAQVVISKLVKWSKAGSIMIADILLMSLLCCLEETEGNCSWYIEKELSGSEMSQTDFKEWNNRGDTSVINLLLMWWMLKSLVSKLCSSSKTSIHPFIIYATYPVKHCRRAGADTSRYQDPAGYSWTDHQSMSGVKDVIVFYFITKF